MRFSTFCGLLVALATTTALVQTHPKRPAARNATPKAKAALPQPESWKGEREPYPYLPEDFAQEPVPEPSDPNPVYNYVEQMPTLNGQHALFASIAAITRSLVVPADAPEGRVFVKFVVTKQGTVSQPQVLKGLRADVDSAVVAATRKLPRFAPGKQKGRVVAVSLTIPVTFPVKKAQP